MIKTFMKLKRRNLYSFIALAIATFMVDRRFSMYRKFGLKYPKEDREIKIMSMYSTIISFIYPNPDDRKAFS